MKIAVLPAIRGNTLDALPCSVIFYGHRTRAQKGERSMDEMNTNELNQFLENIAQIIELTFPNDETAQKSAEIVRQSKVKA